VAEGYTIRPATYADMPDCMAMAERFYAHTPYAEFADFCPVSVGNVGRMMLNSGILLVAEHAGQCVGVIGMLIAPFPMNNRITGAHEVLWWVDQGHRASGAGVDLLTEMIAAAARAGARVIQMMRLEGSPAHVDALYSSLGFARSETGFLKVL